jgi:hypothetical protein
VRRLSAYQRDYNPGFVYGLARTHEPRRENWLADSEAYWDELQALLHGETEAAAAPARKAPPPRKVVEGPEDADDDDSGPIPPDWEWFSRTRGKRAVMVGGDPREPALSITERIGDVHVVDQQHTDRGSAGGRTRWGRRTAASPHRTRARRAADSRTGEHCAQPPSRRPTDYGTRNGLTDHHRSVSCKKSSVRVQASAAASG